MGFWTGGKFFEGEAPLGILDKQKEELKDAKTFHYHQDKLLQEKEGNIPDIIFQK
jgi:hypothetical protein